MLQKIRKLFTPPNFDDEDKALSARILYGLIAMVVGVTFFLSFPLAILLPNGGSSIAVQGFAALGICALIYFMVEKGAVRWASMILLGLFFLVMILATYTGGGIQSNSFMNFMLLVFAAGLLLGARAGFIMTALSALLGLAFLIAQLNGRMPEAVVTQTPFTTWFSSIAVFAVVAVLQGISARTTRDALRTAREAETRYRLLVEQIPAVTYLDNPEKNGVTEYISPQAEDLLGIDRVAWMKGDINYWLDLVHPEDREEASKAYTATMQEGIPFDMEYRMIGPGGRTVWVHDKAYSLTDPKGKPKRIHGVIFDNTDKKLAELEQARLITELESKNAEMERFVYTVSHDLKSPIVTIVGFLGYIEDDVNTGNLEAFHKDIERVYQAAYKMQNLMKDLLELSRVGRVMNETRNFSFGKLIDEVIETTDGRLKGSGVSVHVEPDLPVVNGDRQRLLELIQNLIDNAAKYMGDQHEPLIEIGTRGSEGGMTVFFVRDNGIGISPEHHEQIFGLFNKLDPSVEGTGVGLALVKRIVEFHGGRIWVQSEAGQGSTFYFTLPAGVLHN